MRCLRRLLWCYPPYASHSLHESWHFRLCEVQAVSWVADDQSLEAKVGCWLWPVRTTYHCAASSANVSSAVARRSRERVLRLLLPLVLLMNITRRCDRSTRVCGSVKTSNPSPRLQTRCCRVGRMVGRRRLACVIRGF